VTRAAPREIETLEELDAALAGGGAAGAVLQGLDLRGREAALRGADLRGTVLLGCRLAPGSGGELVARGALLFPELPGLPFEPFRPRLYTPEELYDGFDPARPESYRDTLDARVYAHWQETGGASPPSLLETLARRLHDHAVEDALEEVLEELGGPTRVVAVMGGHSLARDDPAYRQVVHLARRLTRGGFVMASGGGPGAMEAANLGAWLAPRPEDAVDAAVDALAAAPTYRHPRWLAAAFEVRARFPLAPSEHAAGASLGIPTWLYGHEPPNAFATHVAKYFANAVREEGLLALARGGVVFSPGSAGTIQEIFQDACQNHYESYGPASPMVFLGEEYWTRTKRVYPLLEKLAEGRGYAEWLALTDDLDAVVELLERYREAGASG